MTLHTYNPTTNVPTKYQLPTLYSCWDIARTRFYRSSSLWQGQRSNQGHIMTLHTHNPQPMSLPRINFLHLAVSEIQTEQIFSRCPPAHLDTVDKSNTQTDFKGCRVKMFGASDLGVSQNAWSSKCLETLGIFMKCLSESGISPCEMLQNQCFFLSNR